MQHRIKWIDILRGIGIVCIVFSHVLQNQGYISQILYSFHVPLFFFMSGLLFKDENVSIKILIERKAKRILLPYFAWGSVSLFLFLTLGSIAESILASGRSSTFGSGLVDLLYGYSDGNSPLWFLPASFLSVVVLWCIVSIYKRISHEFGKAVAAFMPAIVAIVCALLVTSNEINRAFWSVDDVVILFLFTWGGYLARFFFPNFGVPFGVALVVLSGFMSIALNGRVTYITGQYHNLFAFYIIASCAIIGWTGLAKKIKKCSLLEYLGRNTMAILLMHKFPVLFFQCLCPYIKDRWAERSMFYMVLITVLSICMSCIAGEVLRRFIPIFIGETKRRHQVK